MVNAMTCTLPVPTTSNRLWFVRRPAFSGRPMRVRLEAATQRLLSSTYSAVKWGRTTASPINPSAVRSTKPIVFGSWPLAMLISLQASTAGAAAVVVAASVNERSDWVDESCAPDLVEELERVTTPYAGKRLNLRRRLPSRPRLAGRALG